MIPQCRETALALWLFAPLSYPTALPRNARIRTGVVPLRRGTYNKTILEAGPGAGQMEPCQTSDITAGQSFVPSMSYPSTISEEIGAWHE